MTVIRLHHFDLSDPSTMVLDLASATGKDVVALVEFFEAQMKKDAQTALPPFPFTTAWHDITPELAIAALLRNRPGANRRVNPPTVLYYASMMARGEWKATGQPAIFDANEVLIDAQHRFYAALIAGAAFRTFIVTDVEPIPGLFAYIDNSHPRTGATALQTAGYNGVAPVIAKVIRIGEEIRHGVYNPGGAKSLPRLSPADTLHLAEMYPNAQKAARSAASDWAETVTYLGGRKDIVAYLGMQISTLYGEEIADDFFEDIIDDRDRPSDHPIGALRKLVEKDCRAEKPMKRQHMLAALIKVFNAWQRDEALNRRWMLQVNEDFPTLNQPEPRAEAAE